MKAVEIKDNIFWVGGIDWNLREFHGYKTQKGSTYNSYLLIDEKVVLVDTVKDYKYDEMLERIKSVIDLSKIDYVVVNHVEMDHSGSLPEFLELVPNAKIITSQKGLDGLKIHYKQDFDAEIVSTGSTFNIGKRNLNFVQIPMVHWPDSMVTYIPEDKLLIPNDAFGQHIASYERFDDELDLGIIMEQAAKYYANIVLPFGQQVQKALTVVGGLAIDMIAPSHGIIWRKNISEIVSRYTAWANNDTVRKAVIVYDSMWHSTEKIAKSIYDAFEDKNIKAVLIDLKSSHISDAMTEVLDAEYICVGSPTLNNNMLPTVASFLTYLKGLAPKDRKYLAFGSYGWGGQSVKQIDEILSGMGFEKVIDPIRVNYVPSEDQLTEVKNLLTGLK
ncbi:FprA family A-type flavoprotein [bacterium]